MCGMLAKDFHKLMKSIASFSNNQANVPHYEENLDAFKVEIIPNDGLYCGGKFEFEIKAKDYPQNAPNVTCITEIYHPNIDDQGEICLNLFSEWVETNTLEDCVQGLLFLLYNPNLDDPLNPLFDPDDTDLEVFAENVRLSLEGGCVDGYEFERNLVYQDRNTGENSTCSQAQENQQTTEGEDAAENVYNGALTDIQVVENSGTDQVTECNTDSNVTKTSAETTDCISGKVTPHRTEEEIFVPVEIETNMNHVEEKS